MSELERRSIERIVEAADALGVEIPPDVARLTQVCGPRANAGGLTYLRLHPDVDEFGELAVCCNGAAIYGLTACTCWEPVYSLDQADPQPDGPRESRDGMCGDCAFRPGSPERATQWHRETLFSLADQGEPFWCHDGMRRPVTWRHPQLGEVPGDPDDWQPPIVAGVPFRADGRPALLCAGWVARRAAVAGESDEMPAPAAVR